MCRDIGLRGRVSSLVCSCRAYVWVQARASGFGLASCGGFVVSVASLSSRGLSSLVVAPALCPAASCLLCRYVRVCVPSCCRLSRWIGSSASCGGPCCSAGRPALAAACRALRAPLLSRGRVCSVPALLFCLGLSFLPGSPSREKGGRRKRKEKG